jgi:predicted GIY-YIG superfamily endonuclease
LGTSLFTLELKAGAPNVFALLLPFELKRKKPARQKKEDFHHNVYVVLLRDAVAKHPSIVRLNPKRDPLKPCVYVGMTGISVNDRFENHKNGYKSAWVVRKYGVRLMPELYEHLNPMPFAAALQMELELAEDLRAAGYTVTGGH